MVEKIIIVLGWLCVAAGSVVMVGLGASTNAPPLGYAFLLLPMVLLAVIMWSLTKIVWR